MRLTRPGFVFLLVVLLSCCFAWADHVTLKNGDRISGDVTRMENGSLLIKTEALGDVTVKWDAVAEVSSEHPLQVMTGTEKLPANQILRAEDTIRLTAAGNTVTVPDKSLATVRSEADAKVYAEKLARESSPHLIDLWSGSADAGLTGARGTNDTTNISLGLRGTRITNSTRLSLSFNSLFARSEAYHQAAVTSANALRGGARYEVNVSDRIFTFGFTNAETDSAQHLDIRNVFGGGAGVRLAQKKDRTFDLFSGVSMNRELFSNTTPDRQNGELLFGEDSTYKLFERATVGTRLSFYPNMTAPGEYRAQLDASASTKLNHWLGWQVTISNQYMSNPAAGSRNNEFLLSTGLRFILGQERPFKPLATVKLTQ